MDKKTNQEEKVVNFEETVLELKPSTIDGIGIFAARDILRGEVIAEGIHESDYKCIIPWKNIKNLDLDTKNRIYSYCIGTPEGFFPPPNNSFNELSIEWYMNHSCRGNIGFDENGDFITIRNVKKGDELTYDYALAESNPDFEMKCLCNSPNCRKRITGNDWMAEEFRKRNLNYMLPNLRKGS